MHTYIYNSVYKCKHNKQCIYTLGYSYILMSNVYTNNYLRSSAPVPANRTGGPPAPVLSWSDGRRRVRVVRLVTVLATVAPAAAIASVGGDHGRFERRKECGVGEGEWRVQKKSTKLVRWYDLGVFSST